MEPLLIKMLGVFSISAGGTTISNQDNRSYKIWNLLAYLIYHRHRSITQKELFHLLWGDSEGTSCSTGALKTLLYRMRSMLDQLWPGAGHDLIQFQNGGYMWSSEIPVKVDVDEFDKLCDRNQNKAEEFQNRLGALKLYQGDFLIQMSSETWIMPVAAYYHNRYMELLMQTIPTLLEQERYEETSDLCEKAVRIDPFHEKMHCYFMRALIGMGDQKGAVSIYKQFSEKLYEDFGIMPEEETSTLYYEALRSNREFALPMETVMKQLQEEDAAEGAMICEYDFFRVLYRSIARSMERNGMTAHVALLTLNGESGEELSRRRMEGTMGRLEEQLRLNLRRGDVAAKCSGSQYVLILQQANYENSCKVCERVSKAFGRRYPHAEVEIDYEIWPIRPDDNYF